jgi:hypothetical protein
MAVDYLQLYIPIVVIHALLVPTDLALVTCDVLPIARLVLHVSIIPHFATRLNRDI